MVVRKVLHLSVRILWMTPYQCLCCNPSKPIFNCQKLFSDTLATKLEQIDKEIT